MATETILVRLTAIGTKRFKRDMEKDGAEPVENLGKSQDRAAAASGRHQRANVKLTGGLKVLAIVAGIAASSQGIGALVSVAPAALIAVLALTAGVVGLTAAIGVMGFAAVQRFKATKDIAGSTANQLAEQAGLLKNAFADSTASGATAVLAGLIPLLRGVRGLVHDLEPAFTAAGRAMGGALRWIGEGVRDLGPELGGLLTSSTGAFQPLAEIALRFLSLLARIGTVAMPHIIDGLEWLADKMLDWQQSVTDGGIEGAFATIGAAVDRVGAIVAVVAPVFGDLLEAIAQITDGALPGLIGGAEALGPAFAAIVDSGALKTLGAAVGDTFRVIATVVGTVVTELQRFGLLKPVVLGLAVAFVAWKVAILAANLALAANPVVLVIAAIAALAVGVVYAYRRFETFRNIVNGAWSVIRAVGAWIIEHWRLIVIGLTGPLGAAAIFIADHFGQIKRGATNAVNWIRDRFNGFVSFARSLPGRVGDAFSGMWEGLKSGGISAINWVIDRLNDLIGAYNSVSGIAKVVGVDLTIDPIDNIAVAGTGPKPGDSDFVGPVQHRALGGPIFGSGPFTDRVPLLATPGEHVWTRDEVKAAGGHRRVEELRRSAGRGPVPQRPAPAQRQPIVVNLVVGRRQLAEAVADVLLDAEAGVA